MILSTQRTAPILVHAVLFFFLFAPFFADVVVAHSGDDIKELTQLTFDPFLSSSFHSPILLQFYSPHCRYCRKFASVYESINLHINDKVNVSRVNGEEHRVLRMRFRVEGFPTFFLITKNQVLLYKGPTRFDELVEFVQSNGVVYGEMLDIIGGPLSPYWNVVASLFVIVEKLRLFVVHYQDRPLLLVVGVFTLIFVGLICLAFLLHVVTTPRGVGEAVRQRQQQQQQQQQQIHAHAD